MYGVRTCCRGDSERGGTRTLHAQHQVLGSRQGGTCARGRLLPHRETLCLEGRASSLGGAVHACQVSMTALGTPGVVRIAPSWKRLELQSETHRHGNKGNNAAPRLTALFPIFPSITFLGLSHSNSDKSHKNCKCGSPRLPGG